MTAAFLAGLSLGVGLTLAALFLFVRHFDPRENIEDDFSDCELPSPTRGK